MKLNEMFGDIGGELITPTTTWKQLGDGSFIVRIEYTPDPSSSLEKKVFVHTGKNRAYLEKLIKDRYGPKKFVM